MQEWLISGGQQSRGGARTVTSPLSRIIRREGDNTHWSDPRVYACARVGGLFCSLIVCIAECNRTTWWYICSFSLGLLQLLCPVKPTKTNPNSWFSEILQSEILESSHRDFFFTIIIFSWLASLHCQTNQTQTQALLQLRFIYDSNRKQGSQ